MTKHEGAVFTAFTGILCGDFATFQAYSEKLLNRPVMTHEFGIEETVGLLKAKSKADFLNIVESQEKHFLDMTKEEQEKVNHYDLREMAHYYGSWEELKKVIAMLEESDNEPRDDSDAWSGGFADNH